MRQPRGTARAERSSNLQGESRGAVPLRDAHRSLAVLMATCLALALAASFAACSGAPEERPAPAATAPPAAPQPTATPSPPPVATHSPTPVTTHSPTPVATPSPTPVATVAPTGTPSPPAVATVEPTATPSPTPVATVAPTGTPSPTSFRYDTYDTTGEVTEPGSYAFLADPADTSSAVTTYEALRDGTATALLIHKSDAHGASQAALYDAVEAGDLFEWSEADDCFVRYKVAEVKPDPAGAVPRKLLAVEWMTYAFTGCSGAVSADTVATVDWGELPDLGGTSLTAPVIHGVYQLVPVGWTGATTAYQEIQPPAFSSDNPVYTESLTEARKLPYWRDPDLPVGWRLDRAISGGLVDPGYGYTAEYVSADGSSAFRLQAYHAGARYRPREASWRTGPKPGGVANGLAAAETRVIAGRPAYVIYSPPGPNHSQFSVTTLWVYDAATESEYKLIGTYRSLRGARIDNLIALARSLFEPPNPLPPPTAFRYDRYDTTGAVAEPGSYAFLEDPADTTSAVTTYAALRDGTTTALLIHKSDAHGASQAALYDAVEAGDLFEWHEADDCFVRYKVTEVKPDPAGAVPRKLLAVEWMTYAFTGCSGTVSASASATVDLVPENLQSPAITVPIRHGPWQLVPDDWTGARENTVLVPTQRTEETYDVAAVRRHRLWREPALPDGWRLGSASAGFEGIDGVIATYFDAEGYIALVLQIQQLDMLGSRWSATTADPRTVIVETRIIDGHPAYVKYSPIDDRIHSTLVRIYNRATGVEYLVIGSDPSISGGNVDAAIEIARSLLPPPTTIRYDTFDTSGAVAEPGSYAFLADPADTTSAVTTYEALRDGTTAALLIHKSDAHGASQAALYDAVEAGDLFEWHEADDCFVRYKVTEVKPDPAGAAPRKLLAVEWMTFAFTGCRAGAVSASAAATVDWGELPDIGGTSLAAPVRHGPFQIIPDGWRGVRSFEEYDEPPDLPADSPGSDGYFHTTDLATAKRHAYWRDPALPEGWTFMEASSGGLGDPLHGYCARWNNERGYPGVEICGYYITGTVGGFPASSTWPLEGDPLGQNVHETRVISGRPAVVDYSPRGPLFNDFAEVEVHVYDTATGIAYLIWGQGPLLLGDSVDAGIAIARSLLESPNAQ